jgi:hypothetical protein
MQASGASACFSGQVLLLSQPGAAWTVHSVGGRLGGSETISFVWLLQY